MKCSRRALGCFTVAVAACWSTEADEASDVGYEEETSRPAVPQQRQAALLRRLGRGENAALVHTSARCTRMDSDAALDGTADSWIHSTACENVSSDTLSIAAN